MDDPEIRHVCPNCGRPLEKGSAYCEHCGAPPVSATSNPLWIRILVVISIAVLVIPIALFGACLVIGVGAGGAGTSFPTFIAVLIAVGVALYFLIRYLKRKDQ